MKRALLVAAAVLLVGSAAASASAMPWWPGGERGLIPPDYPHRVVVVDTIGGDARYRHNRDAALREWNASGADIHLVVGDREMWSPGTITLFIDKTEGEDGQVGPYGGNAGDYGLVALAGNWTRSQHVIAHELGHALGFGHPQHSRPDTVMSDSDRVTALDRQGLRSYFGTGAG